MITLNLFLIFCLFNDTQTASRNSPIKSIDTADTASTEKPDIISYYSGHSPNASPKSSSPSGKKLQLPTQESNPPDIQLWLNKTTPTLNIQNLSPQLLSPRRTPNSSTHSSATDPLLSTKKENILPDPDNQNIQESEQPTKHGFFCFLCLCCCKDKKQE